MKIKIDENLPNSLALLLQKQGHNVNTVKGGGLSGSSDRDLWNDVQAESRLLITLDLDFSDIRQFPSGTHSGIIVLRPRTKGPKGVSKIFRLLLNQIDFETIKGKLIIVDAEKIRIR